jgi:Leucine-rich repeat (LRR) protein
MTFDNDLSLRSALMVLATLLPQVAGQADCAHAIALWKSLAKTSTSPIPSSGCCNYTTYGIYCEADRITRINWQEKGFTGPVPTAISNLSALRFLWLRGNQVTGSIPTTLGNMLELRYINWAQNNLTGTIPNLSKLKYMDSLNFEQNKLTGSIPTTIGAMTNLTRLILNDNQFTGSIPNEIGNLKLLDILQIHNVPSLSGVIPTSVGALPVLTKLWAFNTNLTGFPDTLKVLGTNLKMFPNQNLKKAVAQVVRNVETVTINSNAMKSFLIDVQNGLVKRGLLSSVSGLTVNELYSLCPISDIYNSTVAAGCVAGIYNKYCTGPILTQCQQIYNDILSRSIFANLASCFAWREGPSSNICKSSIASYNYKYFMGYDASNNPVYTTLNYVHAGYLYTSIFTSKTYAPCTDLKVCKW